MSSQSTYMYKDSSKEEGLGRLSLQPAAFIRATNQTVRRRRSIRQPQPISRPRPQPVIDRNPIPAPRLDATGIKNAAQEKAGPLAMEDKAKKEGNAPADGGDFLDGTISVGGITIKKKHAVIGGGATVGAFLLFNLFL